ncbi:MAG: M15 family metallopeptidase [Patescibacteria group bacterium]
MEDPLVVMPQRSKKFTQMVMTFVCLFIAYVAWSEYRAFMFQRTINALEEESQKNINNLKASSTESTESLNSLFTTLARVIDQERMKSKSLEEKVGSLDKLSKSDPQLLKKYSKVYFLNENYAPLSLSTIPIENVFNKKQEYQVHSDILYFLQNMFNAARVDGIDLLVTSAYRSFTKQVDVKAIHRVIYGVGTANQFSAEQGFSEHQLGTTIDFTTQETGINFSKFESTKEFEWLKQNAHKFGFVLSYPKGNTFYAYEPWHWRFVGVNLATELYANEMYFFALDQKAIDGYLINMFDR